MWNRATQQQEYNDFYEYEMFNLFLKYPEQSNSDVNIRGVRIGLMQVSILTFTQ